MSSLSHDDAQAIDKLRRALVDAILTGDAEAYAACFTTDAILMHPDTPFVRGRDAIRDHGAKVFEVVKVAKLVLSPVKLAGAGALAFEVGVQEFASEPRDGRFKSNRQHFHVYERQPDGTWKIAVAMSGNQ